MIISGGVNIYPREVEEVLYGHPAILEAAVIGVPDAYWGEALKAVVIVKPGTSLSAQEVIEFCDEHMAGFKKPKSVDFSGLSVRIDDDKRENIEEGNSQNFHYQGMTGITRFRWSFLTR